MKTIGKIRKAAVIASLLIVLAGCGVKSKDINSFVEEIDYSDINLSSFEAMKGKDNSLDEYSAVTHKGFSITREKGEVGGGFDIVLDGQRASYLIKHLFTDISACYDEVEIITKEGEDAISTHYREEKNPVWILGKCNDEDLRLEISDKMGDERAYFVAKIIDSNNETVREISLEKMADEYSESLIPYYPVLDLNNNLHFVVNPMNTGCFVYYIFSSDSEVLFSKAFEKNVCIDSIDILPDGKVAMLSKKLELGNGKQNEQYDYSLLSYNGSDIETVYEYSVPVANEPFVYLKDYENTIIADNVGIYSCNKDFSNKKPLYIWISHGVHADQIVDLCEQGDGIGVIYRRGEIYNYIYLEPVKEKAEIKQITLAVSQSSWYLYSEAVTNFNKLYPNYNIKLKVYSPNDSLLLTELNSGEGPVMLDTLLTGFDEKKQIWEPLDRVVEGMDFYDKLNSEAFSFGKIDGHLYGIVTEFYIDTLYCNDGETSDWDYKTFIETAQNDKYRYIINSDYLENDSLDTALLFFVHGLDDNYYINSSNNETLFCTDDFKNLVKLIKEKVSADLYIEPNTESGILCTRISLTRPADLYGYLSILGDNAEFIGYPHKDGGFSKITVRMPLVIRKNATLEEKTIACAFIKTLLSYESQHEKVNKVDSGFSIRNDVIEEQIDAFEGKSIHVNGFGEVKINREVSKEIVKEKLFEMLAKSKPGKSFPVELRTILIGELADYYAGAITEEELADHLENRVSLYLEEHE